MALCMAWLFFLFLYFIRPASSSKRRNVIFEKDLVLFWLFFWGGGSSALLDRENASKKVKHTEHAGKIICINRQAKVIHLVDCCL